jgi:exopolysaccharide production protein ExoQ
VTRAIHNGHVLGAAGFLAPILSVYAPLGLAPLLVVVALASLVVCRLSGDRWPVPRHPVGYILAAALVWGAVTIAWGIEPPRAALSGVLRLALVMVSGLIVVQVAARLPKTERDVTRRWLVTGFALAVVGLVIDRLTDASIRRLLPISPALEASLFVMENFNRGITVLGLLSFPLALILWRRASALGIAAWLVVFAVALSLSSDATKLAMGFGGVMVLCGLTWPRRAVAAAGAIFAVLTLAAPAIVEAIPPPDELPPVGSLPIPNSAHHRLQIWRFTADRVGDRPLFGWGYDSSRSIPGGSVTLASAEAALPLHPHNGMLQWWLELGAVGGVLGAALLAAIAVAIRRYAADRLESAAVLGQYSAAVVIAALSFGTWQGWWVSALFLSGAFVITAWQPPEIK